MYHWSERYLDSEMKSERPFRGCWINVIREDAGPTLFFIKTQGQRSYEDLEVQNDVLRDLKNTFGGRIHKDEYRIARAVYPFIPNPLPKLSSQEKELGSVLYAARAHLFMLPLKLKETGQDYSFLNRDLGLNEQILLNNMNIPYIVSVFEAFLKYFFIAYLDNFPEGFDKEYCKASEPDKEFRITYLDLKHVLNSEKSVGEIEAQHHVFQNLRSANSAYQRFVGISIDKITHATMMHNGESVDIRKTLEELLALRHLVIHTLSVRNDITTSKIERYRNVVDKVIVSVAEELERTKKIKTNFEAQFSKLPDYDSLAKRARVPLPRHLMESLTLKPEKF